jgi:hypothetical protein
VTAGPGKFILCNYIYACVGKRCVQYRVCSVCRVTVCFVQGVFCMSGNGVCSVKGVFCVSGNGVFSTGCVLCVG